MIIANSALRALLAIYHLISNARSSVNWHRKVLSKIFALKVFKQVVLIIKYFKIKAEYKLSLARVKYHVIRFLIFKNSSLANNQSQTLADSLLTVNL